MESPAAHEMQSALSKALVCLLLASEKPLSVDALVDIMTQAYENEEYDHPVSSQQLENALKSLGDGHLPLMGFSLSRVAGGYRIVTHPTMAPLVGYLFPSKKSRFSPAALETLSLVAYRQPVTRTEIEEIRGVDCGGILRNLLERGLIRIVGQKDEPGRPLIYGTTDEFLSIFSINKIEELPPLRQIESLSEESLFRLESQLSRKGETPSQQQTMKFDEPSTEGNDPNQDG